MECLQGNQAQFVCINKVCEMKNAFVCSDPQGSCKENHESCSLISLSFLLKKCRGQSTQKNKNNRQDSLVPLYEKAKSIAHMISMNISSGKIVRQIDDMLSEGRPLNSEDKEKISRFISDKNIESSQDNITVKLEKQLEQFQLLMGSYQSQVKESRNKEIEDLRRKLERQEQMRISQAQQFTSKISQFQGSKKQVEQNLDLKKRFKDEPSPIKQSKVEKIPPIKQKAPNEKPRSEIKSKGFGFEEKLSTILKNHVPKGPLFSRVTNDIQTINSFFMEHFETARLLYRASQNDFLVSKFHEKCDGHRYTLTLVLTQFDKVIGGYTPLPWRTGGGEWYEDSNLNSFLFNLTSGQKYPLLNKEKAIWCSRTYGPSFGHPDLQIADKALYNSNSCANFPMCYNNGNYQNTPGSTQLFCGTKNGHFRIRQWEVYELSFS